MKTERILQIMPAAPGWYAKYETDAGPLVVTLELAAWALVENDDLEGDPYQEIEGQIVHPEYGYVTSAHATGMRQEQGHEIEFIGYGRGRDVLASGAILPEEARLAELEDGG